MPTFLVRVTFLIGFFFGILLGIFLLPTQKKATKFVMPRPEFKQHDNSYETWFNHQKLQRKNVLIDTLRYSGVTYFTESTYLFNRISILCLILVHNVNYAKSSLMTWAKHCNHVQLLQLKRKKMTMKYNKQDAAWPLLCNALVNISESFHWVLVVKDDTFAIIENIRYLVAPLDHSSQYYLGHAIEFWGVRYNVGQAGYLISNGSLTALKHEVQNDLCSTNSVIWNLEDYYLGKALSHLNISVSDSRDQIGFATFHGFNLQKLFFPGSTTLSNYYRFSVYPTFCCSPKSVTFQISNYNSMYTYDYLLNKLQIFTSGSLGNRKPTSKISEEEVWTSVLKEHGRTFTNISAEEYYEFWVDLVSDPISFAKKIKDDN